MAEYETDSGSSSPSEGPRRRRRRQRSVFFKRLPSKAFSHYESREEVRRLRYIPAINRRPVDLDTALRVKRMGRAIKMFMCITLYNEEADELKRSLVGVSENLEQLEAGGVLWNEFAVVIVVDGREKMSKSVTEYMQKELKVWDPEMLKFEHKNNDVTCHIFEKTVDIAKHASQRVYYRPLQVIFAVKEKNGGKLNSHLWYFSAFAKQIQPEYCFLLDAGTCPMPGALLKLYEAMQMNPQIGGVCGEIAVRNPRVYNLVEASQHFEYKISHVLDKAMESVFGYVSVLPGAFSAYRWRAIKGEPLNQYFYVEENSVKEMGPFMANMYLAEDRVLCFELLAKKSRTWTLHFVSGAVAETDVPDNLLDLLKQRRRWLNGSFFSLVYYISMFARLLKRSDHSWFRRSVLSVQFFYQFSVMLLSWFGIGSLYLSLVIIFTLAFEQLGDIGSEIMWGFSMIYIFLTVLQLLTGLGSKPQDVQKMYFVSSMIYGLLMVFALGLSVWHLSSGALSTLVLFASLGAFACYILASLLHRSLLSVAAVLPQYLFMLPTYVNIFTIFSFCNMHDISWGTKEGNLENQMVHIQRPTKRGQRGQRQRGGAASQPGGVAHAVLSANIDADPDQVEAIEALAEAAIKAEEGARLVEIQRRKAAVAKEHAEMAKEFSLFRTRLLGLWLGTNYLYVSAILHYDLLLEYSVGIAGFIFWTLAFRMLGSIQYQFERCFKGVWARCCSRFCFRCCWERHYGGSIHQAARIAAEKRPDDQTDTEVSMYDVDESDEDRWGAVSFSDYSYSSRSDYSGSEYSDSEDDDESGSYSPRLQVPSTPMMDLSKHIGAADSASAAVLAKCDDVGDSVAIPVPSQHSMAQPPCTAGSKVSATRSAAGVGLNLESVMQESEAIASNLARRPDLVPQRDGTVLSNYSDDES